MPKLYGTVVSRRLESLEASKEKVLADQRDHFENLLRIKEAEREQVKCIFISVEKMKLHSKM